MGKTLNNDNLRQSNRVGFLHPTRNSPYFGSSNHYPLAVEGTLNMLRQSVLASRVLKPSTQVSRRYATGSGQTSASRVARFESRLPKFVQRIITPIRHAPVSHVTAFLVLHEITAVVPLLGLAAFFHYSKWLPPYISEGKWVKEGTEKFGRYLRKKGWIQEENRSGRWWGRGEGGVRIVVELATAWAVTKALLPLRLLLSVWATPWFARWTVLPFRDVMRRVIWRSKAVRATPSPAAGTGATAAAVLPKEGQSIVK